MYDLFTGMNYQRFRTWVEQNLILPSSLYGFGRILSTIDAILYSKKTVKHNISYNGKDYAWLIDYEKKIRPRK